ncbi:hypothetical protein EI94DRAFT_1703716 [Lactarius quietus]|nr:hypothetical protein EI94DRAFT_1703716 [Lactarius quietus]
MTSSHFMPQPSLILPATIGITFVGPKILPQKTMPGFLHVNRTRVLTALHWLKHNNPLYEHIVISDSRLNDLPTNAVPEELIAVAKHSIDENLLSSETDNYVLEDVSDTETNSVDESDSDINMDAVDVDASFIQGVVDIAASDITEHEILASALANITREDKAEGWAVRRSSDFVNEYPRKTADSVFFEGTTENPNHLLGSFPCLFPYGHSGFKVNRLSPVSYQAHA